MLDSDLAKLCGCKNGTKEINQAVKNNMDKFPKRFSFRLTDDKKIKHEVVDIKIHEYLPSKA